MESTVFEIISKLDLVFPKEIEFLPCTEPFRFLVTVILSGSSTDKMAAISAEKLFSAYPNPHSIAGAEREEIEKLIHGSGLFRAKAKNIQELSRIVDQHGIPDTLEELVKLPGVGEKTASCYLQRVKGESAVVVDTHFERTAFRLGLTDTHDRSKASREIKETIDKEYWSRLSDTVNSLGRMFCRPKPKCIECPLSKLCPKVGVKQE